MTALELVGRTTMTPEPVVRPTLHVQRGSVLTTLQPLVYGYLRIGPTDPPECIARLTGELRAYAKREGLTLGHVFTDRYEDASEQFERNGFSALVDALKRPGVYGVLIPSLGHFSRFPGMRQAMCTLIQLETGARVLVMNKFRRGVAAMNGPSRIARYQLVHDELTALLETVLTGDVIEDRATAEPFAHRLVDLAETIRDRATGTAGLVVEGSVIDDRDSRGGSPAGGD